MQIKSIDVSEYAPQIQRIAELHRLEVEPNLAESVQIDFDAYRILARTGDLIVLGVLAQTDELVGYAFAFVAKSFHYGYKVSTNDALFVLPQYRHTGCGLRLMQEVERISKEKGARFMLWQAKPASILERILPRRGCVLEESVYRKEL